MHGRPLISLIFIAFVTTPMASACGGAEASDLFADPAARDPGSVAPPASTGPEDSGPGGPDARPPTDATPPQDSRPPEDSSKPDTIPPRDGGTGKITCGAALSCESTQTCCAVFQGTQGNYRFQCGPTGSSCPALSTPITCDSPADCPAPQICCGDRRQSGTITYYDNVRCVTSCDANDTRFCDPAVVPTTCQTGETCRASMILVGLFVCGRN